VVRLEQKRRAHVNIDQYAMQESDAIQAIGKLKNLAKSIE